MLRPPLHLPSSEHPRRRAKILALERRVILIGADPRRANVRRDGQVQDVLPIHEQNVPPIVVVEPFTEELLGLLRYFPPADTMYTWSRSTRWLISGLKIGWSRAIRTWVSTSETGPGTLTLSGVGWTNEGTMSANESGAAEPHRQRLDQQGHNHRRLGGRIHHPRRYRLEQRGLFRLEGESVYLGPAGPGLGTFTNTGRITGADGLIYLTSRLDNSGRTLARTTRPIRGTWPSEQFSEALCQPPVVPN